MGSRGALARPARHGPLSAAPAARVGEIFVIRRNPFVFEELLENIDRRRRFATQIGHDLGVSRSRRIGKRTKQCLSKPVRKSMSFSRPAINLETARS